MSSILDALKKSEAERQQQAGPALLGMRVAPARRMLPPWAVGLALLLLLNLGLLAWLALHGEAARPSATPLAAAPAVGAASMPAPAPAAAPMVDVAPGLAAAPPAADAARSGPPVAMGETPAPVAARATPADAAAGPEVNPADLAPATQTAPGSARPPAAAPLPQYATLSASLPPLRLDLHAWSERAADRYALINMHRVREGDTLPEGARVQQITREGVVLDYRGTEFLLGRE